jgi:hypothetical protein
MNLQAVYFYQFDERITPAAPDARLMRTEISPIEFQLSSLFSITYGAADFGLLVRRLSGFRDGIHNAGAPCSRMDDCGSTRLLHRPASF